MTTTLPNIVWCHVSKGPFTMGEGDKPHTINLEYDYWLAKYPITNRQYDLFMQASGYTEVGRPYWTEAGWAEKQKPHFEKQPWSEPRFWHDDRFNISNYPVVGVSWYETVAYCRWLTAALESLANASLTGLDLTAMQPFFPNLSALELGSAKGWQIRLPTEAEWEKAARGPKGHIYPWGNDSPTPERANYKETEVGATCAVGLFPQGLSPYGVADMAGNVWEWCATKGGKNYPYRIEDEWAVAYLEGTVGRSLRGGAFFNETERLRAAFRSWYFPSDRFDDRGFRVVCVPIF